MHGREIAQGIKQKKRQEYKSNRKAVEAKDDKKCNYKAENKNCRHNNSDIQNRFIFKAETTHKRNDQFMEKG